MTTGFETYNDAGTILLASSNLIGWYCARTGTGTTVARSGVGNTVPSKAVIPVSGSGWSYSVPLVAIRMDGYAVARAANVWSTGEYQYATSAPIGTGFTWYLYDYSPRLPAVNNGIETFGDDGTTRTFSSGYTPLKTLFWGNQPGRTQAICGMSQGGYRQNGEVRYYRNGAQVPEGEDANQYRITYDCKLYGGTVAGENSGGALVSFDDVTTGLTPISTPLPTGWNISTQTVAVDVTSIPVPGVFF